MISLRGFVAAVLGVAVVAAFQPLSAQQSPSLTRGQRVRVTARAAGLFREIGTLEAVTADSVVLLLERAIWLDAHDRFRYGTRTVVDTVRTAIPRTALQRLDVSVGRRRHILTGFAIGLGVGAAIGGAVAITAFQSCRAENGVVCGAAGLFVPLLAVPAGLIGALAGISRTDVWAAVPLERVRISMTPLPAGRLGLGALLAF